MNRRLKLSAFPGYLFIALLAATIASPVAAQVPTSPEKPAENRIPFQPQKPEPDPLLTKTRTLWPYSPHERVVGVSSLPVTRGVQLRLDNRTVGRIVVHGWDRDLIEAHASSERGNEVVVVEKTETDGPKQFFIKADYANLESGESPTKDLELPPLNGDVPIQVHLEVNVPRYTEIELIRVIRSDVEVTGIETAVGVMGKSSNVMLKDVGSVEAHTATGWIMIENARGIADVSSSTGKIVISNSRGAVRAVSITGSIEIKCVKGRIDVSNAQAPIELDRIDGDVDAIATNSDIRFKGPLSEDGRYYMRSTFGRVETIIPADTRGFNATLTSYNGSVESDFSLVPKPSTQENTDIKHRLAGRFGKGSPQITLDSFQGLVKLTKAARNSIEACK
jgi:hypothetical protein